MTETNNVVYLPTRSRSELSRFDRLARLLMVLAILTPPAAMSYVTFENGQVDRQAGRAVAIDKKTGSDALEADQAQMDQAIQNFDEALAIDGVLGVLSIVGLNEIRRWSRKQRRQVVVHGRHN